MAHSMSCGGSGGRPVMLPTVAHMAGVKHKSASKMTSQASWGSLVKRGNRDGVYLLEIWMLGIHGISPWGIWWLHQSWVCFKRANHPQKVLSRLT